ncbi:conserved hypothetical protein [Ricinus communis]|uniref:Uncharacterized protein n=1 Tax=Ricinus communis TaxID=3988 RepID=B9S7X3_RICCO|nr:conserved hypothetical protein [Ricinus communis]|eukprot:XP_002522089.1 uncharacterized protein LOC8268900 [Ricinus communis]
MRNNGKLSIMFMRIARAPIKVLRKARDVYVNSMLGLARGSENIGYGTIGGDPATNFPRDLSVNNNATEVESYMRRPRSSIVRSERRSYGLDIGKLGRIDEDRVCSFRKDLVNENLYRRRSVAYHKRNNN